MTKKRLSHAIRNPVKRLGAWMAMRFGVSGIHGARAQPLAEGVSLSARVKSHAWQSLVAIPSQALTENPSFATLISLAVLLWTVPSLSGVSGPIVLRLATASSGDHAELGSMDAEMVLTALED